MGLENCLDKAKISAIKYACLNEPRTSLLNYSHILTQVYSLLWLLVIEFGLVYAAVAQW